MWSSDYPHQESTFGYTRSAIQAVFDSVGSVEAAQRILGKTALDVFRMHEPYAIPEPAPKPKRARRTSAAATPANRG
jgi:hypothetical protein